MPPRCPRGRTSRRAARIAAVNSSATSHPNRTSARVTLKPLAKKARYPGFAPSLGVHAADREDDLVGLAREQVAAACAAVFEQPDAGRVPSLDLRAVVRRGAGDQPAGLLLHPAEGRDVRIRSEQDPGLAGTRLGGQVRLPLGEPVAALGDPSRHGRRAAVPHRAAQDGQGEPVDLEEDDPGDIRGRPGSLVARHPLDHAQGVLVVVVGARRHVEDQGDGGDHQGREQRAAEGVDADHVGQHLVGDPQRHRVDDQDRQEARDESERQPKRRHQRRQDGVEGGDHRGNQEGAPDPHQADPRDDGRRHVDGGGRHQPGDGEPPGAQLRPDRLPAEPPRVERGAHGSGSSAPWRDRRCSFRSRLFNFASPYEDCTSSRPPDQPNTQDTRATAKITSQAETISCWATE